MFKRYKSKKNIKKSHDVIGQSYDDHDVKKTILAWTGGKDSTLLLWLVREFISDRKLSLPKIVFINEGDLFKEVVDFSDKLAQEWGFEYEVIQNDNVLQHASKIGDVVQVKDLDDYNQNELTLLGYEDDSFKFQPESMVGNHLMKTVPLKRYIESNDVDAVITGIRWDEQEARSKETYFSERKDPEHIRVHPILHFSEKDVWDTTHEQNIPYVSLYKKGYRSLGAKTTTGKESDKPAWEQDLDSTKERGGRAQDKEKMMERLRDLGYM